MSSVLVLVQDGRTAPLRTLPTLHHDTIPALFHPLYTTTITTTVPASLPPLTTTDTTTQVAATTITITTTTTTTTTLIAANTTTATVTTTTTSTDTTAPGITALLGSGGTVPEWVRREMEAQGRELLEIQAYLRSMVLMGRVDDESVKGMVVEVEAHQNQFSALSKRLIREFGGAEREGSITPASSISTQFGIRDGHDHDRADHGHCSSMIDFVPIRD